MTPRFVVAQVGHTGSGYTAALFTAAGIPTGHEAWFNPLGERDPAVVGDSSWCAHLELERFDGLVFHQVREPLLVLRSLLDEGIGTDWDTPYTRLRHQIIGGSSDDPLTDAMRCWVVMNGRAEKFSILRWRVEDIDDDVVFEVAETIGWRLDPEQVAAAVAATSKTTNKHHIPKPDLGWDDLPRGPWLTRLLEQAARYGYDV